MSQIGMSSVDIADGIEQQTIDSDDYKEYLAKFKEDNLSILELAEVARALGRVANVNVIASRLIHLGLVKLDDEGREENEAYAAALCAATDLLLEKLRAQ